ncbi:P-loop NTPase [bacterium]|nr:P-loop NTPase [bacterium]RQV97993.1 MAG: cobyrinic acid ac-diamide synthase [bacterium]
MNIAISSGKGGTGKTFIATNLAKVLSEKHDRIHYLDCDVEEPNGHLFIHPVIHKQKDVTLVAPMDVDEEKCIHCGKCAEACHYNAIAMVKDNVLIFRELCHVCGGCVIACPVDAILEKDRKIGIIKEGASQNINVFYALLETAEGGMSPRLVQKIKEYTGDCINILDSSPGTSCPVVETVKDVDLCVLVTDPTPFGINDLKLSVDMAREIGQEPAILVNRAEYHDDALKAYCEAEQLDIIGEIPDERKIAESYSRGEMAVDQFPEIRKRFEKIADDVLILAEQERPVRKKAGKEKITSKKSPERAKSYGESQNQKPRELVVISGKGGTGKTSLTASFTALAQSVVIADCDVDAADLHLVLSPQIKERGLFSGGVEVRIDQDVCTQCGKCKQVCRFSAVREFQENGKSRYEIDALACEGCGVCELVCADDAIKSKPALNGEWFMSDCRHGPMSHAKLGVAEENSGRLVTIVRDKAAYLAQQNGISEAIMDGAPGTGCPVISSITGAEFALAVTEPTVSGIHDLERVLQVIHHFGVRSGVIVNKYDLNEELTHKINELAEEYGATFLGTIPYGKEVTEAQMQKLSVVEYTDTPLTESIKKIWEKMNGILHVERK